MSEFILCKHFGDCGGCSFQDIPYQKQVEEKYAQIEALSRDAGFSAPCNPVHYYPEWFYRNKMEFCFSEDSDNALICGLYSRKYKGKICGLQECRIFSPDAAVILPAVTEFCRAKGYTAYNKYRFTGFLRHVLMRQTKFTNQMMVCVVTTSQTKFDGEEFSRMLHALKIESEVVSVYHVVNDSQSDAIIFEQKHVISGQPYIQEQLGHYTFAIGPESFFQVNPRAAVDFYARIRQHAHLGYQDSVLDLFCGTGTIGMHLARDAKFVWGAEIEAAIVAAAWRNARVNHVHNISFFVSDTKHFLNAHSQFFKQMKLLVVNPPRCGMSPKVVQAMVAMAPERIFYSSCNPHTMFEDLKNMTGYVPQFFEPFDFFPHTPHCECLTVLHKNIS